MWRVPGVELSAARRQLSASAIAAVVAHKTLHSAMIYSGNYYPCVRAVYVCVSVLVDNLVLLVCQNILKQYRMNEK